MPFRRFSTEPEERWNREIRLGPQDRFFALVLDRFFPRAVRPNHLTLLRLVLTPVVVAFLAADRYAVALPLFVALGLTDYLDGAMARVRREVTEWGIVYDSVADKMLVGSVIIVVIIRHAIWPAGIILMAAEALVVAKGWHAGCRGIIRPANIWGKTKMVLEVISVALVMLNYWFAQVAVRGLAEVILIAAAAAAVMSVLWKRPS